MATPEQNTLLALQLFGQPAQQYREDSANTNAALLRMATAQREEQLRRDIAAGTESAADKRLQYQAKAETDRQTAMDLRQGAQLAASEKRQKEAEDARQKADIENEFDKLYPQYAAAAARAGNPVKQRTAYESSRAGLGQLAADFQAAAVGYQNKQLESSADVSMSELEDRTSQLKQAQDRLATLDQPSPEDQKMARSNGVTALKKAIEQGDLESTKALRPNAIKNGLDALGKGDVGVARTLLGDDALNTYDSAYQQSLYTLPNSKARLLERTQLQQQMLALQNETARVHSDLRKAAATNPFLAKRLADTRPLLQQLMNPELQAPKKPLSFDAITPPPAAGATTAPVGGSTLASANSSLPLLALLAGGPMGGPGLATSALAGQKLAGLFGNSTPAEPAPIPTGAPDFSTDYADPNTQSPDNAGYLSNPLLQLQFSGAR